MFKTTRGLVLREVRYKEADRILTVLTEDMGKMTVKARGALRKGSKIAAATQFLVFSELTMLERNGFWTVSEGSTIEEFKGLRDDITALSLASYFAECIEALSDEGNPDPLLFAAYTELPFCTVKRHVFADAYKNRVRDAPDGARRL